MKRWLFTGLLAVSFFWCVWWLINEKQPVIAFVQNYVEGKEFLTLEARYRPEQIMRVHKETLIPDEQYDFQPPALKFYPYLLLEVKYLQNGRRTKEGVILWSLMDGEMVMDTGSWRTTRGLKDAIRANATAQEFVLMRALFAHHGSLLRSSLQRELEMGDREFSVMVKNARRKQLISEQGEMIHLHLADPQLPELPETELTYQFVTKPYSHAERMLPIFSHKQIEAAAVASFGEGFAIQSIKEVFLPVYRIEVLNPDDSHYFSYWNALTGERIEELTATF